MKMQQRNRQLWQVVVLIMSFMALALITTRTAQAEVVTVCPDGGDFATVQPAIDAAQAGDTITLCAATYAEPLHIDKDLILRGEGQAATIIGGQTMTTAVSLSPDATITLADLTLAQGSHPISDSIAAASVGAYTDTFTITNELNLSGGDQVTTIINGDVTGNVVIVQANTKVYVVNVNIALPATASTVIAALAGDDPESSTFDGACSLPLDTIAPPLTELLDSLCDLDALNLAIQNRLDMLPPSEAAALATAAYEAAFDVDSRLQPQGVDQVTTIANGDISRNLVIVQANSTVDVKNFSVSLTQKEMAASTDSLAADVEDGNLDHLLFLPMVNR